MSVARNVLLLTAISCVLLFLWTSSAQPCQHCNISADGPSIAKETLTSRIGSHMPFPLFAKNEVLHLNATGNATKPWIVGPLRTVEQQSYLNFQSSISSVVIDIGTYYVPDSKVDFWFNQSVGFLWFDPTRNVIKTPLRAIDHRLQNQSRVMPFAAVVAPHAGTMILHVAKLAGCTSLLPLSNAAQKTAGMVGQGHIKKIHRLCTSQSKTEIVPAVSGQSVMALIHPSLEVPLLSIDAQGFDLMVLSSFGLSAARANVILLECQDLPAGHPLFLTVGAASCADIKHCIESTLPHRMIDGPSGNPAHACQVNNPTTSERNCAFRRMDRNYWWGGTWRPKVFGLPFVPLKGNVSKGFTCPIFG